MQRCVVVFLIRHVGLEGHLRDRRRIGVAVVPDLRAEREVGIDIRIRLEFPPWN